MSKHNPVLWLDAIESLETYIADESLFRAFYENAFPVVFGFLYARLKSADVADDLTSDVFTKILARRDTYDAGRGRLSTWIFTIARNTMNDFLRRSMRNTKRVDFETVARTVDSDEPSPHELLSQKFESEALLRAMGQLSAQQREVLSLKYWSGMRNQDIADVLDITPNNVAVICYRAIRTLHTMLSDELAVEGAV